MVHRVASKIASYSVSHHWIKEDDAPFCTYALERRLETSLFFSLLLILAILSNSFVEIFSFTVVFLIFRRRMGGIHANSVWLCQTTSLGLVLIVLFILGPIYIHVDKLLGYLISLFITGCAFVIRPAYPPQVHFEQPEIDGNIKRKNKLLLFLAIAQFISWKWINYQFVVYSTIGLAFTEVSVLLERIININRKECTHYEHS